MKLNDLSNANRLNERLKAVRQQLHQLKHYGASARAYNDLCLTEAGSAALNALVTSDLEGQEKQIVAELKKLGVYEESAVNVTVEVGADEAFKALFGQSFAKGGIVGGRRNGLGA